jgi:hypothetical protein
MMVLIQTKVIIHALLVWEMEEWVCKCKKKVLMAKETCLIGSSSNETGEMMGRWAINGRSVYGSSYC